MLHLRALATCLLLSILGCNRPALNESLALQASPGDRSRLLENMPTNSDQRCIGIAAVMEALLQGEPGDADCEPVATLAASVFQRLTHGTPVRLPAEISVEGRCLPLPSAEALAALSTQVADRYKEDYHASLKTEAGRQRLVDAAARYVRTLAELDALLHADGDQTIMVCGTGRRSFPDGAEKDTYHAFLIGLSSDGSKCVYDPNDPGAPLACQVEESAEGLTIGWTGRYRDTGQSTTQSYQVVPAQRFFRLVRGEEGGDEKK